MRYWLLTDKNSGRSNMSNFCISQPKRPSCSSSLMCALSPVVLLKVAALLLLRTARWHICSTAITGIPLNLHPCTKRTASSHKSTVPEGKKRDVRFTKIVCIRSNSVIFEKHQRDDRDNGSVRCHDKQKQKCLKPIKHCCSKKKHQLVTEKHHKPTGLYTT